MKRVLRFLSPLLSLVLVFAEGMMAFSAVAYGIPELLRDIRLRAPISGETNVTLCDVASLICVGIAIYGYWLINQSLKR